MFLKRLFPYAVLVLLAKLALARYTVFGSWGVLPLLTGELCLAVLLAALVEGGSAKNRVRNFLWVDAILSLLLLTVVVFHAYFGRVPSVAALTWANRLSDVGGSVLRLFKPIDLLLVADLPLLWIAGRMVPGFGEASLGAPVRRVVLIVAGLAMVANVVAGVVVPAGDLTASSYRYGLVSAQAIDAVSNRLRPAAVTTDVSDPAAVQARADELSGYADLPARPIAPGEARDRNVIVVVMECLQGLAVGRTVGGQPVTPNIDRLAADGLYMPNGYSQVSAGNTADAEFIASTSLYPLGAAPTAEALGDRAFPSLPRMLRDSGYDTLTFHVNDLTFWNRDELYPALGIDTAYEKSFFGNEDVVGMGSSDEVLYARALPELRKRADAGTPFFATFVTITSHHPFRLPDDRQRLDLTPELQGTLVGDYLVAQNYADHALGTLIDGLKESGLYEDSIIVVFGDHFGLQQAQMSDKDMAAAEALLGRPYNDADRTNVPIVIAEPGAGQPRVIDRPTGQIDIVPTVMAMLGLPREGLVVFGRDVLVDGPVFLGVRYYLPAGSYITEDDVVVVRSADKTEVYDARTRAQKTQVPPEAVADVRRVTELQELSDAYLEALPRR